MIGQTYRLGLVTATQSVHGDVILAVVALVIVVAAGAVALAVVRRRAQNIMQQNQSPQAFTLDQLRQLHKDGQLTETEFQRAKAQVISMMRGDLGTAGHENEGRKTDDTDPGTSSS
jgi:hypothetical protein